MAFSKWFGIGSVVLMPCVLAVACSSSNATDADAGTGDDASTGDGGSKVDSGRKPDVSTGSDAQVCALDANAVAAFKAAWEAPAANKPVCTAADIKAVYEGCLSDAATQAKCSAAAQSDCGRCILPTGSNDTDGPLSERPGNFVSLNQAGCIAIKEGKIDGSGCGGKVSAYRQCLDAGCLGTCNLGDDEYDVCTDEAEAGGCAQYANDLSCTNTLVDAGTINECIIPQTANGFQLGFETISFVFCGGRIADGGTDGTTDGASTDGATNDAASNDGATDGATD